MKEPDEIMAEYLLKGGKMLSRACTECGSPLFEYKDTTRCVVCEYPQEEANVQGPSTTVSPEPKEPMQSEKQAIRDIGEIVAAPIEIELRETILNLCRRIQTEPDPNRCLVLMQCLREGVIALRDLA